MNSIFNLETKKYLLKLDNFEGPLDLLCHLVDKNKMDIYKVKISDVAISLERNMEVYDNDFQPMLIESVKDSLKTELANTKDTLTKLVENVVNDIIDQMKTARENGIENSARASSAIDNTRALAENIERLKEQKQNLVEIKACVEPLQIQWSEIIKTE